MPKKESAPRKSAITGKPAGAMKAPRAMKAAGARKIAVVPKPAVDDEDSALDLDLDLDIEDEVPARKAVEPTRKAAAPKAASAKLVQLLNESLGWELRAQVPVQLPDGTNGVQVVRFVGVDGPRWFLRGVISGQGAVQPQAAGVLEHIFRDTVIVRGEGPMAPRDPIVLKLPDDAHMVPDGVQQEAAEPSRFGGGHGSLQ